jgi:hypothetical protein
VIRLKAKAVQQKFEDTFVNGDTAVDAKSFDGIDKLCDAGQTVSMGTNGATLALAKLDEAIDLVKGGKPDILLMSKRTRRTLNNSRGPRGGFRRRTRTPSGNGAVLRRHPGYVRLRVRHEDGGTSTDCSTVYAMQLGEGALAGLTAPGGLQVETIGSLETKDATRTRVKWYVSMALFNTLKLAKLAGVRT